jgi:hypothetical protein
MYVSACEEQYLNNTEPDWLTGGIVVEDSVTTTSYRVSMGQRLATPNCTTRFRAYRVEQLGLLRRNSLTLRHWHVFTYSEGNAVSIIFVTVSLLVKDVLLSSSLKLLRLITQ